MEEAATVSGRRLWWRLIGTGFIWIVLAAVFSGGNEFFLRPIVTVLGEPTLHDLMRFCGVPLLALGAGIYHRSWRIGVVILVLQAGVLLVLYILMLLGRLAAVA
jgi:hypothetical protein